MPVDAIRRHVLADPFQLFVLRVADGRNIPVFSRDHIMVSSLGNFIDVFQPDDTLDILDADSVAGIDVVSA